MLFFKVDKCTQKACLHWRQTNKCVKDHSCIPTQIQYLANIHDATICQIRKQTDTYRLTEMLEE